MNWENAPHLSGWKKLEVEADTQEEVLRGVVERKVEEQGARLDTRPLFLPQVLPRRTFDHPLLLITYPYIAQCMGACSAKGGWSLLSLSLSPSLSLSLSISSLSPLYTVPNVS